MEDPAAEATRLFSHNTVRDSLDYLYSLSRTIDESSHSLRSLVGDSEKDLLSACERIADMQASSAAILALQDRLRRGATQGDGKINNSNNNADEQTRVVSDSIASSSRVPRTSFTLEGDRAVAALHVQTLSDVVLPTEKALSLLCEGVTMLRAQLVNVDALLLARRTIASCGALKEVQGVLEALNLIAREVRTTLTTTNGVSDAVAAAAGHTKRTTAKSNASRQTMYSGSSTGAAPNSPLTPMTGVGSGSEADKDGGARAGTQELATWVRRYDDAITLCSRSESDLSRLEMEVGQYELEVLRTMRRALQRAASQSACDTLSLLSGMCADASRHNTTGGGVLASESVQRYCQGQQRRQTVVARYMRALFSALDGLDFADVARRWLDGVGTAPSVTSSACGASSSTGSPLRLTSPLSGTTSPLMATRMNANVNSARRGSGDESSDGVLTLLTSLHVACGTDTATTPGPNARTGGVRESDGADLFENPRAIVLRLIESLVLEAARTCTRVVADDAQASIATPNSHRPNSALQTRHAALYKLVERLDLPPSLKASFTASPPGIGVATPGTSSSSSSTSSSLPAVAVFLVAQAKFLYASLCECLDAVPSTTASTAASATSAFTRTTNVALLMSADEEEIIAKEMEANGFTECTAGATTSASSPPSSSSESLLLARQDAHALATKQHLWERLLEDVRSGHVALLTASNDPASRTSASSSSSSAQAVLTTLLEAKNALLFALAPSATSEANLDKNGDDDDHDDTNDDDDDGTGEQARLALQLAGPVVRAARRRQYVDFLLHASASVSAYDLVRYRTALAATAQATTSAHALYGERDAAADGRVGALDAAVSRATRGGLFVTRRPELSAERLEALVPADRARLVESQSCLLRPYAAAVVGLLGQGDPLLLGAYLRHERDVTIRASSPPPSSSSTFLTSASAPSGLFDSVSWLGSVLSVLSDSITRSMQCALTALLHLQGFATSELLEAATRAAEEASAKVHTQPLATLAASSPTTSTDLLSLEELLPQCAQFLRALETVARDRSGPASSSALTTDTPNVITGPADAAPAEPGDARRLLFEALRNGQGATADVSGSSAASRSLLGRLSTCHDSSQCESRAAAPGAQDEDGLMSARARDALFSDLATLLSEPMGSDVVSVTSAAEGGAGGSPAPVKPSDSAAAHTDTSARAVVLTALSDLLSPSSSSATATTTTSHKTATAEKMPSELSPHRLLQFWSACVAHCVFFPVRLSAWLRTPQTPASTTTTTEAAAASQALLANLGTQQQVWLSSAMAALRAQSQTEATARQQTDNRDAVRDAARAFELSRIAFVLYTAAATPTAAAACRTESRQLFVTLHEPWRALLRQEARDALGRAYVTSTVKTFTDAFGAWSSTGMTAAVLADPHSVWSDGYRTAHGQRWCHSAQNVSLWYPFLPTATLERLSWRLERVLQAVRALAPRLNAPSLSGSAVSGSPSSLFHDVLDRSQLELAEAALAVVDSVLLPALRKLPETLMEPHAAAAAAGAAQSASSSATLASRTELDRVVKVMTNDYWVQLYFDLAAWRSVWLPATDPQAVTTTAGAKTAATTLAERFDALLRHCTLHGDAARWSALRPVLEEAVRTWQMNSGLLHGLPPPPPTTTGASNATAGGHTASRLTVTHKVARFSLLPISSSVPLRTSGTRSMDAGLSPTTTATASQGGALHAMGRGGANRLAHADAFGSQPGSGGGGDGGYAQRFYAPPPPQQQQQHPTTSGESGGALFVDPVSGSTGRGATRTTREGIAGAAALWDQTQKGWNTFWGGGHGGSGGGGDGGSGARNTV